MVGNVGMERKMTALLAGAALGLAAVVGTVGCNGKQEQSSEGQPQQAQSYRQALREGYCGEKIPYFICDDYNNFTSSDHIGGRVLEANEKFADATIVRNTAITLESQNSLFRSFILYDVLKDRDSMQRVAAKAFLSEHDYVRFMLERVGIQPTERQTLARDLGISQDYQAILGGQEPLPSQFKERGDAFFNSGNLNAALSAYTAVGSAEDISRVAGKAVEENDLNVAFDAYRALGTDKAEMAARSIAKRSFLKDYYHWEEMMEQMGIEVIPELLNEKAEYLFTNGDFDSAFELYLKAGNQQGAQKALEKMLEKQN